MAKLEKIWGKIETEFPKKEDVKEEKFTEPEQKAEELLELAKSYYRQKSKLKKEAEKEAKKEAEIKDDLKYNPETQEYENIDVVRTTDRSQDLERIKDRITKYWGDKGIEASFKELISARIEEISKLKSSMSAYNQAKKQLNNTQKELDKLYAAIYSRRDKEPEEIDLIEMIEQETAQQEISTKMAEIEKSDKNLSAKISYERMARYRTQLKTQGFIVTPSREKYMEEILEHLVVLDQNRPLLLTGETGTGKTRLARAACQRLTKRPPYEVGEEAKTDIRPLLGSKAIDEKGSYISYGPLGQALTGKKTSRDKKATQGGIFYMDEMNSYPADALRSLIKQISGRKAGETVSFAAWAGAEEAIANLFGFVGSANLASEKHPDRQELPVEVSRELSTLEIDYHEQTPENPEIYEMLLCALLDKNNRLRVAQEEIEPEYEEIIETDKNIKRKEAVKNPEKGGALWRFANFVAEIQKSYKGQENVLTPTDSEGSYLRTAVLDAGEILSWIGEYQKTGYRRKTNLRNYLGERLGKWSDQKKYPEEDRNLLKKFIEKYDLTIEEKDQETKYRFKNMTPVEIGMLTPRTACLPEKLAKEIKPDKIKGREDGNVFYYESKSAGGFNPEDSLEKKGSGKREIIIFKGIVESDNQAVLEIAGELVKISIDELAGYERIKTAEIIVADALNPYKEGLEAGGIANQPEKKEIKLNLMELLEKEAQSYETAGLPDWANDIRQAKDRLLNLTPEKRKVIEQEIKDGAIPIFMPGKEVQKKTKAEELGKKLKPLWIENSQARTVKDAGWWDYFQNLIDTEAEKVLAGVPDSPYISLMRPTQKVSAETINMTVADQLKKFAEINTDRQNAGKQKAEITSPQEYAVMQKMFTEQLNEHGAGGLKELKPLDCDTYTRFISLPVSGGLVPFAVFAGGSGRVGFGGCSAGGPSGGGGFRLSVRVKI